jgi:putative tricarboxylic transport membrane protein
VAAILAFGARTDPEDLLAEYADDSEEALPESHPWLLLAGIGATLGYVALVPTLGFFLCTATYLAAFMAIGLYRRWTVLAAVSVIGTLLLMFVFMKLVYVSLPIGAPPFDEITLALMRAMGIR